jgi:hypothetical protein
MAMKIIVLAAVIIGAMTLPAHGQTILICRDWNFTLYGQQNLTAKQYYILGFSDGVAATAFVNAPTEERRREVSANIWPPGVTAREMILLLDEYCAQNENFSDPVLTAIIRIAKQRH